jgi:hypothetical protein
MKLTDVTDRIGLSAGRPTEELEKAPEKEYVKPHKKEVLYSWEGLSRSERPKISKKASRTMLIIGIIVALLLLAMQEFWLVLAVLALIFASYMLAQVPPETVRYEITNQGITYIDRFYEWPELSHYFFMKQNDLDIVAVDVTKGLPGRLYLTINPVDKEKVSGLMNEHLTYLEEQPKTVADKAYDKVVDKVELEK